MAFPTSQLSSENVLRDVHDPVTQTLRTTATATIISPPAIIVDIDQADDSIAIGDGTNLFTSTNNAGKISLDVNVSNVLPLNTRQLAFATDKVDVSGSSILVTNFPAIQEVIESGLTSLTYNEVTSVPNSTPTTVVSYTALVSARLKRVDATGTNIAAYTVLLNGNPIDKQYTYFSGSLGCSFLYDKGLDLTIGDVVQLRVVHNRGGLGDFNGKIITLEN